MTIEEIIHHLNDEPGNVRWSAVPPGPGTELAAVERRFALALPDGYRELMRLVGECELIGTGTTIMFYRVRDLESFNTGAPWDEKMKGMLLVGTNEGGWDIYLDPHNHLQRGKEAVFGVPMNVRTLQGSVCLARDLADLLERILRGEDPFTGRLLSQEPLGVPYAPVLPVATEEEIGRWDAWARTLTGPDAATAIIHQLPTGVRWTARPPLAKGGIRSLEFLLGIPIPEALVRLLEVSNGGALKGSRVGLWLYDTSQIELLDYKTKSPQTPPGLLIIGDDANFFFFLLDTENRLGRGAGAVHAVHKHLIPSEQLKEEIFIGAGLPDLFRRVAIGEDVLEGFYQRKYITPPDPIRADY